MKHIFNLIVCAVAALSFVACEDVPAPYEPNIGNGGSGDMSSTLLSSTGLSEFTVKTLTGTPWSPGTSYAKATGYANGTTSPSKSYIISPKLNLTGIEAAYLTYDYALRYTSGISNLEQKHQCLVSTNYTNDVEAATWVKVAIPLSTTGVDANNTWLFENTGNVALPAEVLGQKNVVVAFYFECDNSSTTWEIKNLKICVGEGDQPGENPGGETSASTRETPLSVAQAIANQNEKNEWVKAYIVGTIPASAASSKMEYAAFNADDAANTNIIIADTPNETDASKCMPVQLPAGDVRSLLNLKDNASNLGKEVLLYGTLTTYCSSPGIKTVTYAEIGDKKAGKDPDATVTPGDSKGDGTLANPYNPTAANAFIATLKADTESDKDIYIKGKICSVKETPSAQYGNATYYISEDGTENSEQFYAFRTYYLGNQKFTGTEVLNVGDEVIICGKVVNYKGNTPETVQGKAYIYSHNGQTGEGGGGDEPTPPTGEAKGDGTADNPFNVVAAIAKCVETGETATSEEYYVEGIVSKLHSTYANTFWISDDGTQTAELEFYYGTGLNGATLNNGDVKVGDKVVVKGTLVNYKGNTPELNKGCTIVSINSNEGGGDEPDPNPDPDPEPLGDADYTITSASIASGATGSVALPTNNYGQQNVAAEDTWYTFSAAGIDFAGCRVCIPKETDAGLGIQVQGNANDASKQGFLFNTSSLPAIKSIVITAFTQATATNAPNFNLYAGTEPNPAGTAITPHVANTTEGDYKVYTFTYDLSTGNHSYFKIWNNLVGALYINKIEIYKK